MPNGPKAILAKETKLISRIISENPTNIDKFLGCQHTNVGKCIRNGDNPFFGVGSNPSQVLYATANSEVANKVEIKAKVYNKGSNIQARVDMHLEIAKINTHILTAAIPLLDEQKTKE